MENRKESLSSMKICRFCLAQKGLGSLYEKGKSSKSTVTLPLKILSAVSIEILPSDKKPTYICDRCKFFMNIFYEYKHIVRTADEAIFQFVQNGTALGTVNWPSSLTRVFRFVTESETVKTVVEGGATIQVTSHNISDSDEEDGNVYNVKIGDDEESKACIKVVTSKETKPRETARGKESDTPSLEDAREEKPIEEGCFACDECDCTYRLQQLLDLHKMQKHRQRGVACNQCDAKFFTKYDLAAHQVCHSVDMPFECVACGKKFKRLILLKRHEKMIHPELPQLVCSNCPATFLSIEELDTHQKKHIRIQKLHACLQCDKKFHEKSTLKRHIDAVHNKEAILSCEYCPERFGSITKLARHVRTHVSDRLYPCKYCEKSFTKSHHYTRHLRLKHRRSEAVGQQEQFRCEQCEDVFSSQDDLIFHSAIHATQNLTCPLCQEKFEDVEAVTAHIKSHVNGVEFMCDYCELIFTSQEKLDTHLIAVHEDEMQNEINEESSMEMEAEDEDDDNGIHVKEDGDEMIIEIKKPDNYLVSENKDDTTLTEEKLDTTNSEESEGEATYTELQTVDTLAILTKEAPKPTPPPQTLPAAPAAPSAKPVDKPAESQSPKILRKAEDIKRKIPQTPPETNDAVSVKKIKPIAKPENTNSGGASDKSLRLLEKELQDLKRTNSRNAEANKVSNNNKIVEMLKSKRPQFQTSTPKLRSAEDRKPVANKTQPVEKKQPEKRIVTKENKEPKETKEVKNNGNAKEEKDAKEKEKDNNEKDVKEKEKIIEKDIKEKEKEKITEKEKAKETPKSVIKNGSASEEGVRRSTRPCKVKDYAKMVRDRSSDDDTTEDDEDYHEPDRSTENRRGRRSSQAAKVVTPVKTPPAAAPANAPATQPRKRGRPRKEVKEVPAKVKKDDMEEPAEIKNDKPETQESNTKEKLSEQKADNSKNLNDNDQRTMKTPEPTNTPSSNVLVSPSGQTLKKVPVKALPPGVKAMPLPANARPMTGELCEMQIGKKVVKVQKIVMTKAEVEAMAKKGLVEMKDGTMVLKQGIKLPTAEVSAVKSTLISDGETGKESSKREKGAPTRCDLGEES